jgi:hypothetical protein
LIDGKNEKLKTLSQKEAKHMITKLYIGSNNETHVLEVEKANSIISRLFQGFTAYEVKGYWQGTVERTLLVEIETDNKAGLIETCKALASELKQQAIGMIKTTEKMQFIN